MMFLLKVTLLLFAIFGLFFQISMAQDPTTFITSAVANVPTGVPSSPETNMANIDVADLADEELNYYPAIDADLEDEEDDAECDGDDDDDVVLCGKKPGHKKGSKGKKGKKPKGYKGVKGMCNSNRICDVHDPPHNCKCTHPGLTCTCKVPFF
ncbi:hypothetical protein BDV59DRAFT_197846 [Aspergillus ambiguus]|uniref:uncharacterized protein n=1 Tax=Aspergillus ambiguus TaxID=176160 RepID=UPI003CCD45BB